MSSKIELEYIKCNICGKDDYKYLFTVEDKQFKFGEKFSIVKCRNCGLVYLNPRPKRSEIGKFYPEEYFYRDYFSYKVLSGSLGQILWQFFIKFFFGGRSDLYIISYFKNMPRGKLLDVGCGCGALLKLLKDDGWETHGVDISSYATKKVEEIGLDVFTGELIEAGFLDKYFDIVILHHSLEHIYDPAEVLREVFRILKDNGILIIGVPNIKSIEARIFRQNWFPIEAPRHLYHFSLRTLDLLLNKTGFARQTVWFDPEPIHLFTIVVQLISNKLTKILTHRVRFIFLAILYPFTSILAKCHLGTSFIVTAKKYKSIL